MLSLRSMTRFNLNAGAIIGAVAGEAIALIIAFCLFESAEKGHDLAEWLYSILLGGGALAGNYLWSLAFKKPK